jgi:hypothetical protein
MQSSCKEIQCICEWKNNKILPIPETMQGISTSAESKEERSKKKKKKKKVVFFLMQKASKILFRIHVIFKLQTYMHTL